MTQDVLDTFDWNQFEFIALGKENVCLIGKNSKKQHSFNCEFYTTKICMTHSL